MDIRGTENSDRGNPRIRTQRIAEYIGDKARERASNLGSEDVSRTEKARIQNARKKEARLDQTGGTERADRLEFSSPASRLAEAERSASRLAESDRVSSLRDLYQAGELNTPDRIERAIERMLERGTKEV
ncbi:MAG: hypothetical protein ACYS26_12785 [Planctomycetota bacterium]|jgi:hypothetical protein